MSSKIIDETQPKEMKVKETKHKPHSLNNSADNYINDSRSKNLKQKTKQKRHIKYKHQIPSGVSTQNYISTLINLFYDNDNVSNIFLKNKDNKSHIFPEQNRVIVIGDIHGDFDVLIRCLSIANCIKDIKVPTDKTVASMDKFFNQLEWIGNDTYIVQLGDQIDRVRPQNWDENEITIDSAYKDEGSTLEILYLFYYLDILARKTGGRVFSIIGNHEIMNVEGDFRFVSLEEFKSFKSHLESIYNRNSKYPYHSRTLKRKSNNLINNSTSLPIGYRERLYAFSPTGLCANMLAYNNYTILQIGDWLFCHGSPVLSTFSTYDIKLINNYVSMYLLGIENNKKEISKHYQSITQSGSKSVLWNRDFGEIDVSNKKEDILKSQLNTILEAYNHKNRHLQNEVKCGKAKYIAVGHTIQDEVGINSICNKKVWRCDVAMSKAFGETKNSKNRLPQVLQILNGNKIEILS